MRVAEVFSPQIVLIFEMLLMVVIISKFKLDCGAEFSATWSYLEAYPQAASQIRRKGVFPNWETHQMLRMVAVVVSLEHSISGD